MITKLMSEFETILVKIRSGKILNKIGAGKRVFFENPREKIAFKYIPGDLGRLSKYFVKQHGQNEYEIYSDSSSILAAVLEGRPISKAKYDNYDLIEEGSWNIPILKTPVTNRAMGA